MKWWVVVLLLVLCAGVQAEEKSVTYQRTFDADDTVAAALTKDTSYTDAFNVGDWWRLWFTVMIDSWGSRKDTNLANDTVYFKLQHSPTGLDNDGLWVTRADTIAKIGLTSADLDTILQSGRFLDWDTTSAPYLHKWVRFMIIYRDSTEADVPGLLGNSYYKRFTVWAEGVKR